MASTLGSWVPFVTGPVFMVAAIIGEIGALKIEHIFLYVHSITTFCVLFFVLIVCLVDLGRQATLDEMAMYSPSLIDLCVGIISILMAQSVRKSKKRFGIESEKNQGESGATTDFTELRETHTLVDSDF